MQMLSDIKIYLNGKPLQNVTDIHLKYSLSGSYCRQFSFSGSGLASDSIDDFHLIQTVIKQGDTSIIDIFIDEIPWLKGYLPFNAFEYKMNAKTGSFSYRVSNGFDRFIGLEYSTIISSCFPNLPIKMTKILGNILEELHYVNLYQYKNGNIILNTNGTPITIPLLNPIKQNALTGLDLLNISPAIDSTAIFTNTNFPGGNPNGILAKDFINNLIGLIDNFFILSNGINQLNIDVEGGTDKSGTAIGVIGTLIYSSQNLQNNSPIIGWEKFNHHHAGKQNTPPFYTNVCLGQLPTVTQNMDGINTGGLPQTSGTCTDQYAIPHLTHIDFLRTPATNQQLQKVATKIANTRRAHAITYKYEIGGTFYTNQNELYEPNRYIQISDDIHQLDGQFLISDVALNYSVHGGSSVMLEIIPPGSFEYSNPEKLVKAIQKYQSASKVRKKAPIVNTR